MQTITITHQIYNWNKCDGTNSDCLYSQINICNIQVMIISSTAAKNISHSYMV